MRSVSNGGDFLLDRVRHLVYIDDLCLFGFDPSVLRQLMVKYLEIMRVRGLPAKPAKIRWPTCQPLDILGLEFDGTQHTLCLAPHRMRQLICDTRALLDCGVSDALTMQRLAGRWIWSCLPFRPALAVLGSVFRFCQCAGYRQFDIWQSVRWSC